jgi:hypothetical protein
MPKFLLVSTVPIYNINGNVSISNVVSTASIQNTVPIYSISGSVNLGLIQSSGAITYKTKFNYKEGGSFRGISLYVKKDGVFIVSEINLINV